MSRQVLPARLIIAPIIDNYVDDSDPHYDFRKGYAVRYHDSEGWHEAYYGQSEAIAV